MTDNPSISYINKPVFPYPSPNQRYNLRYRNWIVPFSIPSGHKVKVLINDTETTDFSFSASVVVLDKPLEDGHKITITTIEDESDNTL